MRRTSVYFWLLALLLLACCTPETMPATPRDSPQASSPPLSPTSSPSGSPVAAAQGTIYYVRPDGGDTRQCTGLVDSPYAGSGDGRPCAWDHPFRALPPGGPPRITGGDTVLIAAGQYMLGYGAPGADNQDVCSADWAWECHMPPLPSGPDRAHPTRLLGAGWDAGCPRPPQLWGTERANWVVDLTGSSNIEVACLEITDHSGCVEDHTGGLACQRDTPPFGPWAGTGLFAQDSAAVRLADLEIHGLAHNGVWAGRLRDWTVERVRIAGNGWAGWDGDIGGEDSDSGTMTFRHWTVEWNGCGETYPGGQPSGCWAQTAGGYGDGVGTGTTGGHWVIEDSAFLHNTSDGLDLLYARLITSSIEVRRTIAAGNAGNQMKMTGPTRVENAILVSNCGYFDDQPFTYNVDPCRAGGDALVLVTRPGDQDDVVNSTLTGSGTCLVIAECAEGVTCTGSEQVHMRNNVFQGQTSYFDPEDATCFAWYDDESGNPMPANPFLTDYAIVNGTKFGNVDPCAGDHVLCATAPGLVDAALDTFDAHLLPGSLAIDAGTAAGAPADDFEGRPRDALPDLGAHEWSQLTNGVYLPLALRHV